MSDVTIMKSILPALALIAPLATAPLAAQEQGANHDTLLAQACEKMATLNGVGFRTLEAQDNAMMRQFRSQMPVGDDEEVEVEGKWSGGVLQASVNFDEDQVIRYAGRTITRGEARWKLRADTLASGVPMPFMLDPRLLFDVVNTLPADALKVRNAETARYRGQDVVILGVTLTDNEAGEVHLSGAIPKASGGPRIMMRLGGGMGGMPADETTIDMAFYVDAESGLVHRVRAMVYHKSGMAGSISIAGGIGGGDEEIEEEEPLEERDADGNRIYKKGLPVRNLEDDVSLVDFDVSFSDHGKTFAVELAPSARKLLRL